MGTDALSNVDPATKPRLIKLLHAINVGDLALLYTALRECDEKFRKSLTVFVAKNHMRGWEKALDYLVYVADPMNAVRSATVYLLIAKVQGDNIVSGRSSP